MKNITLILFISYLSLPSLAQDKQQIENLKTFAKVYGYVKYFHPSDAAAQIDWKMFAIHGAQEIRRAKSQKEVLSTMNDLFKPIAPSIIFSDKKIIPPIQKTIDQKKVTYWQHYGLGIGTSEEDRNIYKSVRINKVTSKKTADPFGNILQSLDGEKYKGKEFKYTAWAKLKKGSKGNGRIWVRVDNKDESPGFFENLGTNPIKKDEWKQYEIKGLIDEKVKDIFLGCFLYGEGELLVDNFTFSIKEGNQWSVVELTDASFENQQLGEKNEKSWKCKGFGYKYSSINSDKKHKNQAGSIKYAPEMKPEKGEALFEYKLTGNEIINEKIGEDIFCFIPITLALVDNETKPMSNKQLVENLTKQISTAPNEPKDLSFRLGNTINTYNVFKHFYPYFDVVEVDWEQAFSQALEDSYKNKNAIEHITTLEKFTAKLKDGHIGITGLNKTAYTPPIKWEWVENKLIITKIYDGTNLKIGDEVTHIDGKSAKEFFKEVNSRISGSQGWINYKATYRSLFGDKNNILMVRVNGKENKLIRDTDYYSSERYKNENQTTHKKISDNIFYLNLDIIGSKKITELLPELKKAKAIICDLRGYPNSNHNILTHFLKEEDAHKEWMQIPHIIFPNQKNIIGYAKMGWGLSPQKPYLGDKKIIFITDGSAISYAESVMGIIEGYKLATIVGQPTAGANGNINPFKIAGDYRISWTGMKVIKHDGSQQHNIGILPNVYVEKTIKGIIKGRDEFLEQAIKIANNEK